MVHDALISSSSLLLLSITSLVSVVLLVISAEKAVEKVLHLLKHYGLSATFGGLTIFSITTSFPEIFSHLTASFGILSGSLDYKIASATVLGANIGSDVVQQTFVLGLVIFLMGGMTFKKDFLKTAYLPMIGTTLMCIILGWDREYSRLDGAILVGTFLVYLLFLYNKEGHRKLTKKEKKDKKKKANVFMDISYFTAASLVMLFSAHVLLTSTEQIVKITSLGGSLIGVLTLGIASAAPEFLTAVSGIKQKATGISLGTLIGSNITNPLVAIGGGALISTYWVPSALVLWDLPMETLTALALLIFLFFSKGKLNRWGAVYLMLLYAFYLAVRIIFFATD